MQTWIKSRYAEPGPFKWFGIILELISAATLLGLMLLTCFDVIGRYFFNNSIDGAVEITQIGLAILVFTQMPLITWRGLHIVVDLFDRLLTAKAIKYLTLTSIVIISISFYFLADRIFELAARSLRRNEVTEYLAIPMGYIAQYIAIMSYAIAIIMLTFGVYSVIKNIKYSED